MQSIQRLIVPALGVVIVLCAFMLGVPVVFRVLLVLLGVAAVGTHFLPHAVQVETRIAIAALTGVPACWPSRGSRRGRGVVPSVLAASVVLAVAAAALGAVADSAAAQATGSFDDDDGSVHEPALEALAARGVLGGMGCGERLICPDEPLKRWEMAVWLVRALDGRDPEASDVSRFADVDPAEWYSPFIERLLDLRVTAGCGAEPLRFCPEDVVSRAQMAAFLVRAFDLEPASSAGFGDVTGGRSSHAASIDALAAVGVTEGCNRDPLRFCPRSSVTRAQMATFLARALGLVELPASVRFVAIDTGHAHSCGVRVDGSVACWGLNWSGQADPPDAQFVAVSAGEGHSCGVRTDGTVACWGSNDTKQSEAPTGTFRSVSAGDGVSCGLRTDDTIACWGSNPHFKPEPPSGQFRAVAVGGGHACAVREDGSIVCWGDFDYADVPEGRFQAVASGGAFSCGLRFDATLVCWGVNWIGQSNPPPGRFAAVDAEDQYACGLRTDGIVECWGDRDSGATDDPDGSFVSVSAGSRHSCGLRADGTVDCWGIVTDWTGVPEGQFRALSAGGSHFCALGAGGSVECWGYRSRGHGYAPQGDFTAVAAGHGHACGLRRDGAVACWGFNGYGEADPPGGRFIAVAAAHEHSCGLREGGTVDCWGDLDFERWRYLPRGRFITIDAGLAHYCGLLQDKTAMCWGSDNFFGELDVPDGEFEAVTAGQRHSCGLRAGGAIACWGDLAHADPGYDDDDRDYIDGLDIPEDEFSTLAAGSRYRCGIRTDAALVCFGHDAYHGFLTAPEGEFIAVAAGDHACGLRSDGTIACWGGQSDAVSPPAGVRGGRTARTADPDSCRQYGLAWYNNAGFPLPTRAAPSTGTLQVVVLFADFPDAQARHSARREADLGLPFAERYLQEASYGRLDIEFVPVQRWLRAQQSAKVHAYGGRLYGAGLAREITQQVDPDVYFDDHDLLMMVMPSTHFGGGVFGGGGDTAEGDIRAAWVNAHQLDRPRGPRAWGFVAAHELAHALGLADLYPLHERDRHRTEASGLVEIEVGLMGLRAQIPAHRLDPRHATDSHALEMLAWSRWQLGWLDKRQVRCVTDTEATVTLSPIADPGAGTAMAAVPLSSHEVLVAESRRKIGYDAGHTRGGLAWAAPGLATEGVLVYTVNAARRDRPIRVAGDRGNGIVDDYPILSLGQSVTVRGYKITVVADDGDTHTVTITRTRRR